MPEENNPKVIKVGDQHTLVPTSKYPYAKWEFENFNPVQSRLFEIYENNSNVAIAAATSAGKTVSAEMYLAYELRKHGGKGIYVGPLKSLAKEKQGDWTSESHHFYDLKTFIATGDFRFTSKRIQEMEEASIIVMTPEMLASRARSHKSEKSQFLQDVRCIVFDESHLLTVPNRGDHIEVALMKLVEINPDVRIVFLSATMPNVDEICGWISKITGRDTYYLESEYRPCPLVMHYETYYDGDKNYDSLELQKIGTACAIVEHYKEDKFLVFTHTKKTGHQMVENLSRYGIKAEFHYGDLEFKQRVELERKFKEDKEFRVLVSTSTLAWGCNLPARRVIITGVHRGLSVVENYDIQQMVGRSGRPKYDPRGDAYILVPESEKEEWIKRIKAKSPIRSTLLNFVGKAENPHYKTLAFHIVAEIHQGGVNTKEAFHSWFRKSLAYYQDHRFDDEVIDKTIALLTQCKAISVNSEGIYEVTPVGRIASMFYYSPFDVSDLRRNFHFIFEQKMENNDYAIAMALGNIDSNRWGIVNRSERAIMSPFQRKIEEIYGQGKFTDSALKMGCVYHNLIKGKHNVIELKSISETVLTDLDRTMQVINAIDTMSGRWGKEKWFKTVGLRVRYGVSPDLVELCRIPNVGGARAKKLKAKGINTLADFTSKNANDLADIMKCGIKLAQGALDGAKEIETKDMLQ